MSFLEQIEVFLLELRDSYGFSLPVDRLIDCLASASDITDVEEVFYRLQSLICSSQEQVESYQSLFGQRFLGMVPSSGGDSSKPGKVSSSDLESRLRQMRNQVHRMTANSEQTQEEQEKFQIRMRSLQDQLASDRKELEARQAPVSEEHMSSLSEAGTPDLSNPKVRTALNAVSAALMAAEQVVPQLTRREEREEKVKRALATNKFAEDLDAIVKDLMADARRARDSRVPGAFAALLQVIGEVKNLKSAASRSIKPEAKQELAQAERAMRDFQKNNAALIQRVEEQETELRKLASMEQQISERTRAAAEKAQEAKKNLERLELFAQQERARQQQAEMKTVVKEKAVEHRPLFEGGINAVQTTAEQAELLKTDLRDMTPAERAQVLSYIRANARLFRQTLRRKTATPQRRRIDVKATVRRAMRTNGEPLIIRYKAPKPSHARVVILTDISGSCFQASWLALYFMALMDEAFPGGCKKFVFVNSLVPVDKYFRDRGPKEGVEAVMSHVPTRGIYSDYGSTIHTLRSEFSGYFQKDTTVIILGDARNNGRRPYDEDLKYIADRCARMFFLNTDQVEKWNMGDSIIGLYEKAGAEVFHVSKVGELLSFLSMAS